MICVVYMYKKIMIVESDCFARAGIIDIVKNYFTLTPVLSFNELNPIYSMDFNDEKCLVVIGAFNKTSTLGEEFINLKCFSEFIKGKNKFIHVVVFSSVSNSILLKTIYSWGFSTLVLKADPLQLFYDSLMLCGSVGGYLSENLKRSFECTNHKKLSKKETQLFIFYLIYPNLKGCSFFIGLNIKTIRTLYRNISIKLGLTRTKDLPRFIFLQDGLIK